MMPSFVSCCITTIATQLLLLLLQQLAEQQAGTRFHPPPPPDLTLTHSLPSRLSFEACQAVNFFIVAIHSSRPHVS